MNEVRVVTNLPDFKRQLRDVAEDMQLRATRNATAAAAAVFRAAVRRNAAAPKSTEQVGKRQRTGNLARAVRMAFSRRNSNRGKVSFVVGIPARRARKGGTDAFYWRFLEGGWIPRGRGQALRGGRRTKALLRSRQGGGQVQYPFIRPAFQQAGPRALAAFNQRMAREVERIQRTKR
jgi:HK97 gp10 family phage protein